LKYSRGTEACHQWGDAANITHHQVSMSSPQTEDGSSQSPHATSVQMQKSGRGQSGRSWYPKAKKDRWHSVHHATIVRS